MQKKQALHTINRSSPQSLPVNLAGRLFTRFSGKRAYKGSLNVRFKNHDTHRRAAIYAITHEQSLNSFIEVTVEEKLATITK